MKYRLIALGDFENSTWKRYEQELQTFKNVSDEHARRLQSISSSILRLEGDIHNEQALKSQVTERGLDAGPLDSKINAWTKEVVSLRAEQETVKQLVDNTSPVPPYDRSQVQSILRCLKDKGIVSAEVLPSLSAVAEHFSVDRRTLTVNCDGMVIAAQVRFADHLFGEVAFSPTRRRYLKLFRPKTLRWLPLLTGEVANVEQESPNTMPFKLFVIEDKAAMLAVREFDVQYEEWEQNRFEDRKIHVNGDVRPFMFASNLWRDAMNLAGETIDLEKSYDNPILTKVQEAVIGLTLDSSRWSKNTEFPSSDAVLAELQNDLPLVVAAPWSNSIDGTWAKLKYTLESGERPRVWRNEFVGHYGFRLRTRDHSWLVGEIYIDPIGQVCMPGTPLSSTHSSAICKIGRMCLLMCEDPDRR